MNSYLQLKELRLITGQDLISSAHAGASCGDGEVRTSDANRSATYPITMFTVS
jgi:hypothetical protein